MTADRPDRPAGARPAVAAARLTSIDALRGVVMIIMALDHTRDFVHAGAMSFSPEDLTRTTPLLFFTRWITHICAPVFVFLAGTSVYLRLQRVGSRRRVSWFLLTRGLWLIVLELTVMRLAMNFSFASQYPVLVLILCALGVSMMALAALVYLPTRVLAVFSLAVIGLHNTLDGIRPARFGALAPLWQLLHQPGAFVLHGQVFVVGYPVLPWIAVMAAGFCCGSVMLLPPQTRRRGLVAIGVAASIAFVGLRLVNAYGDPSRWSHQASAAMTVVSFFRVTKYPPSLDFLLMTLGPALILLALLERRWSSTHPLMVLGRVPLFYYVVHFWLLHVLTAVMAGIRYGAGSTAFLLSPLPSMGGAAASYPPGFGYPLWTVYIVWAGVVLLMYPLCRWFAAVKATRHAWWLSYV